MNITTKQLLEQLEKAVAALKLLPPDQPVVTCVNEDTMLDDEVLVKLELKIGANAMGETEFMLDYELEDKE